MPMIWKFWPSKVKEKAEFSLTEADLRRFSQIAERGITLLRSIIMPDDFRNAEKTIRMEFLLYERWSGSLESVELYAKEKQALVKIPELAQVFLFHGDGRLREAALNALDGKLASPASVYALFSRLNDWVPEVRQAALLAMKRVLHATLVETVIPAMRVLLRNARTWGRWSKEGREAFNAILMRPDIVDSFVGDLVSNRDPNSGSIFREILRNPYVDHRLAFIFDNAPLPHIRAIALNSSLSRTARWSTGERKRVWHEHVYGRYQMQPVFERRPITVPVDLYLLVEKGVKDRASIVRKCAVDGMIALRHDQDLAPKLDAIAATLKDDSNVGVRERIDFYLRKRAETDAAA